MEQEILANELQKINNNYWYFLDMNYPIKISNYRHREEIKSIDNIEKVKEIVK